MAALELDLNGYFGQRMAAHKFVPQDHNGKGIMVAFAPPQEVVDKLTLDDEDAELAHDLHITMAYLGKTDEYKPGHLKALPRVVSSWARSRKPIELTVQGSGTFLAPEEGEPHVLHALVNSPGLHRVQAHLVDHLKAHGYAARENHGYIPHITLGYTKHTVRFLPKVSRQSWTAKDIWTAIGGERQAHLFGGR